jgi:hypothetical protein
MIGTVFASPIGEINEMEIHIERWQRTRVLHSAANAKRIRGRRRPLPPSVRLITATRHRLREIGGIITGAQEDPTMTALAAPKLTGGKWLECFALYAVLQGVPIYSGVALAIKLIDAAEFVGQPFGAVIFVAMMSTFHAMLTSGLGARYRHFFRHSYEPLFADTTLSFSERVSRWLAKPNTAVQLLSQVLLLSALAIGVASIG